MIRFSCRSTLICLAAALSFTGVSASAQEIQVFSIDNADQPSQLAIPSGGLSATSMFGVDPNSRSALFNLLANESVRRELQLKDDEYASVKKIMQESQKRLSDTIRANMAAGNKDIGAGLSELMAASKKASEAAIEEILLPAQLARIRQLAYQVEITQIGLGDSLTSGRLGKEIDVHEDQKQHLIDKAAAIEAETRLAIAKIRAAARDKLLAELAPEQRKKAEELLGPHFEYEEPNIAKTLFQRKKVPAADKP